MVRVLLFGRLSDLAGWRERIFEPTPDNLISLKAMIRLQDEGLANALDGPGVRAAVDKALALGDAPLAPGAEVAFLPPMSGG
jgi:molybdopterin synthase sulfur carrier subunit